MDWNKFWTLFHKRWGSDKVSNEYNKEDWNNMQAMLRNLQEEKVKVKIERRVRDRRKK